MNVFKRECGYLGCDLPQSKGPYCNAHYIRSLRGRPMAGPVRRAQSDPERFWEKVAKGDDCWEWKAFRDRGGYGRFMVNKIPRLAHRVSFERAYGPIPSGLQIDHKCHNTACVNPEHLRLADRSLNAQNLSGARSDSASGIRGVRLTPSGRWTADTQLNGERSHLGIFDTPEDANAAVVAWRRENMPYSTTDQKEVA